MLTNRILCCSRLFFQSNVLIFCTRQRSFSTILSWNRISKNNRFKIIQNRLIRYENKSYLLLPKCSIHTTPRRYNPIISVIARQVLKVATMFTARAIRKWYQNLPKERRKIVFAWLAKHKLKFLSLFILLSLSLLYYYESHLQETPITQRKRFIAFTPEQFRLLNRIELETKLNEFSNRLLPGDHSTTRRVAKVVKQLIEANRDIKHIDEHDWTVSVIDDPKIMNAFVLPSGNIFVFSGLLSFCDNDHQLGIILAHEISHAILAHGIELASHAHIVDLLFIGLLGFVWMFFPTDTIAAIGSFISKLVMNIMMETPYSKMLETEADEVGINLAAKSCFDIREASVFWSKMAFMEQSTMMEMFGQPESPVNLDFLNTHPSHKERSKNLDSLVDDAILCRSKSGCPPLPHMDPRIRARISDQQKMNETFRKELQGIFHIKDLE
ncbi:metalloendopeptidase OMA1, mitochondrial [Dermatophagoides farinae]|uniref:metalloendopeptidase OMA1, mitochondrial n=1 Tax=Dermatophagoides farinae TaxID=6954 RepID=UPI003F5DF407